MKIQSNVIDMGAALYGKWISDLEKDEITVYMGGCIGMSVSRKVMFDKEDVDSIGGDGRLEEILDSLEQKSTNLKGTWAYNDASKAISRVRKKFFKERSL